MEKILKERYLHLPCRNCSIRLCRNKSIYYWCRNKRNAKSPALDFNGNFIYDFVEVKIDEESLTEIAKKQEDNILEHRQCKLKKYNTINKLETSELESIKFNTKNEEFYLFSWIALVLFLLSFLLQISYFPKNKLDDKIWTHRIFITYYF